MSTKLHPIYRGKIIQLNLETVVLPNRHEVELEIVHHPGGVAVLAEDSNGRICLIRQYRHAAGGWVWELPAGKRESGEGPEVTARRELLEEVGVEAGVWSELGKTLPSPGILTEVVHLFYACDLTFKSHAHEAEEVIEIHWFAPEQIESMIREARIVDAKTLVGLYLYKTKQRN